MLKKLGILREEKQPVDKRTPIIPADCKKLMTRFSGLVIYVQPSKDRCFTDDEYRDAGVIVQENILDCNIIMGVKEVPIQYLIPGKRYMFFSHTIKKQAHNLKLLQTILDQQIELIDYEALEDINGTRVVAFGYWAGVVGTYNAIWMSQKRNHKLDIPRLYLSHDYNSVKNELKHINQAPIKYLITGTGRVAKGALDVMKDACIVNVSKDDFLSKSFNHPVYTQLSTSDMFGPKFKHIAYSREEFHEKPLNFKSIFEPYLAVTDVLINAIYWDARAPKLFTLKDMKKSEFKIKSIADITCDIAPEASIPSTLKATTIPLPVFGFLPLREKIVEPFTKNAIDVMSIANLPSELPRDASTSFSADMIELVIPEFFIENSVMIKNATVTKKGKLTDEFMNLESFVYDDVYRASKIK
jgi:saccharopine dehydrogenase (NAD+, L-lysine forming)